MDLLKKAYLNPKAVSFNPLKVENKRVNNKINTPFLSKEYSSDQLFFFITNHSLSYTDYLKQCKINNIIPVSYTDQTILIENIKKYENFTFNQEERHIPILDYSFINQFSLKKVNYLIIVSSAENSSLNLLNIKHFLKKGLFLRTKLPLEYENKPIKIDKDDTSFIVTDNFNYKSKESKIVAVFLDDNPWQLKNSKFNNLKELSSEAGVFFISEEENKFIKYKGMDVTSIKVENNKKIPEESLMFIWKKIFAFKNKKIKFIIKYFSIIYLMMHSY